MKFDKQIINILKTGGIGILPTDTLYGLVGRAELPSTVERIYKVRKRSPDKPLIILISKLEDLNKFGVAVSQETKKLVDSKKLWPGMVSVIFPVDDNKFNYLTRGTGGLAFRLPDLTVLRDLIKMAGPLVAPSANIEGENPSLTIEDAKKYFKDSVDFYVDDGTKESLPSTLIKIQDNKLIILREGAVKIQ